MRKRFGSEAVSLVLLALCLAVSFPPAAALAQEQAIAPDTIVSRDGELAVAGESAAAGGLPNRGTGRLVAGGTMQIPEAELNVPSLDELLGYQAESIIPPDSRTRVTGTTNYPNRAIAYLYVVFPNNAAGSCTGWFIGPRTVITAGHCVFSGSDGGWARSIKVYPGRNGSSAPYGYTYAHNVYSVTGWTTSGSQFYDYGAIQTNTAKGNTVGWFGWRWQSSNAFPGTKTVRGYPGDKPPGTMWTMSGGIYSRASTAAVAYARKIWYSMDTMGGQSGSPVYGIYNAKCCYGFGIHAYGTAYWPRPGTTTYGLYNSGTRITLPVSNNFSYWRNRPYP